MYEEKEKPMTLETLFSPCEWMMQEKARNEGLEKGREDGAEFRGFFGALLTGFAFRI